MYTTQIHMSIQHRYPNITLRQHTPQIQRKPRTFQEMFCSLLWPYFYFSTLHCVVMCICLMFCTRGSKISLQSLHTSETCEYPL